MTQSDATPDQLQLTPALYRGAIFAVALVALVLLGLQLKWVLVQLFAAGIVAAGMAPIVSRLSDPERTRTWRWRPPSALVVLLIYLVVAIVVLTLGTFLLQVVLAQGTLLLERAPGYAATIQDWYAALSRRWAVLDQLDVASIYGGASGLTQWVVGLLGHVLTAAGVLLALAGGTITIIFVLFMALYLSVDGRSMRDYLLVFLPATRQAQAQRLISSMVSRLGRWVMGELILCVIIGTGAGIGLGLLGVPGASLLALVWAVGELVPGIGPFISAVPTILLGFLAGPTTGIVATIFTLVYSQIENNVIVPRVMGRAVKLNPLVVLVALLVGNELLGLTGALFAIPLAAALAVLFDEVHRERVLHLQTVEQLALEPVAGGEVRANQAAASYAE